MAGAQVCGAPQQEGTIRKVKIMITRKDTHTVKHNEHMRGGDGTVCVTQFMTAEEAEGHGRLFAKIEIPVGGSIGYHEHNGEFEAFYIMDGEGVINDNGEEIAVLPGDFHKCPSGSGHGVRNTGDKTLVMIALILKSEN